MIPPAPRMACRTRIPWRVAVASGPDARPPSSDRHSLRSRIRSISLLEVAASWAMGRLLVTTWTGRWTSKARATSSVVVPPSSKIVSPSSIKPCGGAGRWPASRLARWSTRSSKRGQGRAGARLSRLRGRCRNHHRPAVGPPDRTGGVERFQVAADCALTRRPRPTSLARPGWQSPGVEISSISFLRLGLGEHQRSVSH